MEEASRPAPGPQGMGHGHFDKLSWQLYDNGHEIVRDYGAARFLNVVAKEGGRYLPENESWAKQTVAHNALVVNGTSHFGVDADLADRHAPRQLHFSSVPGLQLSSARIETAYPDRPVAMQRILALVDVAGLASPVVIDVLRAAGETAIASVSKWAASAWTGPTASWMRPRFEQRTWPAPPSTPRRRASKRPPR